MKRYLVFAGFEKRAAGGINDLVADEDSERAAKMAGDEDLSQWADILDTQLKMSKHRFANKLDWGPWVKVVL